MRPLLKTALLAVLAGCAASATPPAAPPATPAARAALVPGNEVRMLVDGPQNYAAMFGAMAHARDSINLETYILEAGDVGERLARLVEAKAAQGVKVNVLYDAVGSIGTPRDYFERLKRAGAALCEFNPVNPAHARSGWEINNRNHRKILVVDGQVGFTGGINISSAYTAGSGHLRKPQDVKAGEGSARGWRDTQIEVEGPAVAQLQKLFVDGWRHEKQCGPLRTARYYPRLAPKGDKVAGVVASDPEEGRSEMYQALLSQLDGAKQRAWLTVGYFVPDPETREAIIRAARRGVDVRLVLPGISDFWAPVAAGRSNYEALLEAGVRIYEWRKAVMHAKTAVIDSSWSSIGSTNLDWRSFVHNWEADVVVRDPEFAHEMERRFLLDTQQSVAIDPQKWKERGPLERIKEALARAWEYML